MDRRLRSRGLQVGEITGRMKSSTLRAAVGSCGGSGGLDMRRERGGEADRAESTQRALAQFLVSCVWLVL